MSDSKKYTLRLYLDKDQDIIDWLEKLHNGNHAIKEILRLSISWNGMDGKLVGGQTSPSAPIDVAVLVEALRQHLLPDMRQVIDASLSTHLAGVFLSKNGDGHDKKSEQDERTREAVQELVGGLALGDDDDDG